MSKESKEGWAMDLAASELIVQKVLGAAGCCVVNSSFIDLLY
jgi:hypothetical protein